MECTGNTGEGTRTYRGYKRDHIISAEGKRVARVQPEYRRPDRGRATLSLDLIRYFGRASPATCAWVALI